MIACAKAYAILVTLLTIWLCTSADLMDLTSEAICAARCFMLFTKSLTGPDRLFLQQRPDLTQPHCINQKATCALCLDVCQWSRAQTIQCKDSCKSVRPQSENSAIDQAFESTCLSACEFARDQYTRADSYGWGRVQPTCPLPENWPSTCRSRCQTDADCPRVGRQLCCANAVCSGLRSNGSLVRICTSGLMPYGVVPPIPEKPMVKQLQPPPSRPVDPTAQSQRSPDEHQYQLELDWHNYYNQSRSSVDAGNMTQYPVVFMVQLRQFHDPAFAVDLKNVSHTTSDIPVVNNLDQFFDEWRSLVWTTKLGAVLSDLRPGTWYQFRLMATSVGGYGGWSEPSRPIRVHTHPVPPSMPRNVTEVRMRLFDDHVDVTIRWEEPKFGNLPLKKYQISWRKYYKFHGEDRQSFTEYEANVPGDKRMYTIQNLPPATAFKIEVKAVSVFEHTELESYPASLYITTPQLPPQQTTREFATLSPTTDDTCHCDDRFESVIQIGQPFWENMELKTRISIQPDIVDKSTRYTVEWAPRVCIETAVPNAQGTYSAQMRVVLGHQLLNTVELSSLSLQCHYKVTLTETEEQSDGQGRMKPRTWSTCFCTPSCDNLPIRAGGPGPRNCSGATRYELLRPVKVTYKLFASTDPLFEPQLLPSNEQTLTDRTSHVKSRPRRKRMSKSTPDSFNAIVSWITDEFDLQAAPTLMGSTTVGSQAEQTVRGVRVTWGPRLYEPVRPDAYHHGLLPLIDPEKVQSKVLAPHSSSVFLRELPPETLYIVSVQLIGDRTDGPASTIFFAVPSANTQSAAKQHTRWTSTVVLLSLLLPAAYLNQAV